MGIDFKIDPIQAIIVVGGGILLWPFIKPFLFPMTPEERHEYYQKRDVNPAYRWDYGTKPPSVEDIRQGMLAGKGIPLKNIYLNTFYKGTRQFQ